MMTPSSPSGAATHAQTMTPSPAERIANSMAADRRLAQAARPQATRVFESFAILAVDFLAVNLAFFCAWYARYRMELVLELDPGNYVDHDVYLPLQLSLAVIFVVVAALRGQYRFSRSTTAMDDASTIFTAAGVSLMVLFAASAFVRYPAESRLTLVYAWALITFLAVVGRAVVYWTIGRLHGHGFGVSRTLVVGDNPSGRMVMQALAASPHLGFEVVGFLGVSSDAAFGRFRCLGRLDALERVVTAERIGQVIIAMPGASHDAVMRIVDHCRRDAVQFRIVPDLFEMSLGRVDIDTLSGVPLLGVKDASISGFNLFVKRALDLAITPFLLVLLSPIYLLLALAIKLDDGGPVFYGQTRVGHGGRLFMAWKFRSMKQEAEAELEQLLESSEVVGPNFKMRDDPRRTRVGRLIRRWSLDELPQFWNVLVGEMSLVGPRPPTPREVALYEDWHLQRLQAPQGITGLWQISGRSELGFDEQVMMDITYIENWSLGLELRILLKTLPAVLGGKGAF